MRKSIANKYANMCANKQSCHRFHRSGVTLLYSIAIVKHFMLSNIQEWVIGISLLSYMKSVIYRMCNKPQVTDMNCSSTLYLQ